MLEINIARLAQDFINTIPAKHQLQILKKIHLLAENPTPTKSKTLEGYAPLRRYQSGKYRIVYLVEGNVLKIPIIDLRNDDRVYQVVERRYK